MSKVFEYDLQPQKINKNLYMILGSIFVYRDGRVTGPKVRFERNLKVYVFNYNRRMYYVGKVVLQLFGDGLPVKSIHYRDGDSKNIHFDNLAWGKTRLSEDYPDFLTRRGVKYLHCPSFEGYYVSEKGVLVSYRDATKGIYTLKQRRLYGIPSAGAKHGSIGTTIYTHQAVLEAFRGIPYGSSECIWLDGNRKNSKLSNLKSATQSEVLKNHFIEGKRDPNKFRNILDEKYGKNKRPWGGKKKNDL